MEVNLPNQKGKRPKVIKDLVRDVGGVRFDKDGIPTTIAVSSPRSDINFN